MPSYNVGMGQAVSVKHLGANTLVTGIESAHVQYPRSPLIASCSAVALVNTETGAAGLYHFPAMDINDGTRDASVAREILIEMRKEINPDQVHFGHGGGVQAGYNTDFMGGSPVWNAVLQRFVQTMSRRPIRESSLRVPTGRFSIEMDDRQRFVVDLQPDDDDVTDLINHSPKNYEDYRLYGNATGQPSVATPDPDEADFGDARPPGPSSPGDETGLERQSRRVSNVERINFTRFDRPHNREQVL